MMQLHGRSIIGGKPAAGSTSHFEVIAPATGQQLPPPFYKATESEIDQALDLAASAFESYRLQPPDRVAAFLERIAEEILNLGDELLRRANAETALPEARLTGERARTVNQLRMFADLVREGSWLEARIDRAQPQRQPLPKPDLRRMLIPLGPVVVFSASNFPLAFSVAGGDTASALAAGNPVAVKAHPGHPGTSELVTGAILAASKALEMPSGVFALVQGRGHEIGLRLVRHPATKAVGFTGSQRAGRALFDAAAARPEPIQVYAEMGSTNPVFVLPGALQRDIGSLAQGLVQSVTLGVGQFCTNPGLVLGLRGTGLEALGEAAGKLAANSVPGTMLYPALCDQFRERVSHAEKLANVRILGRSSAQPAASQVPAIVLATDAATFLKNELLREEMFGPSTLLVNCGSPEELEQVARSLSGQLTATIHGTEEDLSRNQTLVRLLQRKVGRLIFNGFPTGVEVCPSMHHGGPYPAMTDSHFTSVGTAAIQRFARPLCFQNFPDTSLPRELQNGNPRGIWRLVDGNLTRDGW
jgi:alpha-ketoglutaric semialdehyde dehydrogenase